MNNFDDKMFEEDEFAEDVSSPQKTDEPSVSTPSNSSNQEDDITTEVLKLKGIDDPNKIKFEDTSGAVVERSWDSLSRDEQIRILGDVQEQPQADVFNQLDDSEINLINSIRNSGMSVNDYLNSITPNIQTLPSQIESMSDDDLYAYDIINKVGSENVSDEELNRAIELAKSDEVLYQKTIEGLRNQYLQKEQENQQMINNQQQYAQQQRYNAFANVVSNEIARFDSFGGQELRLSNDEKDDLYDFMLSLDEDGSSALGKQLQNPQVLTQVAFWLRNGDKVMEEMQKQTRDAYMRGYNAGKGNTLKSKLVWKKPSTQSKQEFNWDSEDWD